MDKKQEVEDLKQAILECRGLYKGFKIDETTAGALAAHLHHLANYRKVYLVEQETAEKILQDFDRHGVYSKDYTDFMRKEYGVEVNE